MQQKKTGNPPRLGVIGGGKFGYNHLLAFKQLERTGRAALVALADLNPDVLQARKEEFGVEGYPDFASMLAEADLDAVSIATPDHLHRAAALAAIEAGKHTLVEKPLDLTVEGCREICEKAQESGILLQVDFHKRYDPDHRVMARRVRNGDLGEILYGHACMEDRIEVPAKWFPHWAPHSSPAWFLGIHFFDLARWMLQREPVRAGATGQKRKLVSLGIDTYDAIQARVEFEGGAAIAFDTSWILPDSFESIVNQGIRLVGSEGCYAVNTRQRGVESCLASEGMASPNNHFMRLEEDRSGCPHFTGYGIESIVDFAANVGFMANGGSLDQLHGKFPSGEDGLAATRIAVAVHQSLENHGAWISCR